MNNRKDTLQWHYIHGFLTWELLLMIVFQSCTLIWKVFYMAN